MACSDAELITENLVIPFGDADEGFELLWEDDETPGPVSTIRLRLYPAVPATVFVSRGSFIYKTKYSRRVEDEILRFDNSDSVKLQYPYVGGFDFTVDGKMFDLDGLEVNPTFFMEGNNVRSSQPCFGFVNAKYVTDYHLYEYTFEVQTGSSATGPQSAKTLGFVITRPATMYAVYQGKSASIDLTNRFNILNENRQLYQITSKKLVPVEPADNDETDVGFEFPFSSTAEWPAITTFPGNLEVPGKDEAVAFSRVHETGYLTERGTIRVEGFYVSMGKPYVGGNVSSWGEVSGTNFTPKFSMSQSISNNDLAKLRSSIRDKVEKAINDAKTKFGIS